MARSLVSTTDQVAATLRSAEPLLIDDVLEVVEEREREENRHRRDREGAADAPRSLPVRRCPEDEADGQKRRDRQLEDVRLRSFVPGRGRHLTGQEDRYHCCEDRPQRDHREEEQGHHADAMDPWHVHVFLSLPIRCASSIWPNR